jgi:lysophospholipase L1-like esterase
MSHGRTLRALVAVVALSTLAARCGGSPTTPTPPTPVTLTITCPAAQSGVSLQNQPVTISWTAPNTSGGTAPVQTSCTPASGSGFSAGSTTVTCTATDAGSQRATCSFAVAVTRPPQLTVTRLMAFGDSITWGKDRPAVPTILLPPDGPGPPESYPAVLDGLLRSRYPDQAVTVTNAGWPGEVIATGMARLSGDILPTSPQVLLLLHGANDLNTASANEALVQYIANGLRDMVRAARARGAKVFLATFPPQFHPTPAEKGTDGRDNSAGADWVPSLNTRIVALAGSEGAVLVDFYTPMYANVKRYIGNDGLHPTDDGFALMAEIMQQAIRQNLEAKSANATSTLQGR